MTKNANWNAKFFVQIALLHITWLPCWKPIPNWYKKVLQQVCKLQTKHKTYLNFGFWNHVKYFQNYKLNAPKRCNNSSSTFVHHTSFIKYLYFFSCFTCSKMKPTKQKSLKLYIYPCKVWHQCHNIWMLLIGRAYTQTKRKYYSNLVHTGVRTGDWPCPGSREVDLDR